MPHGRSPEDPRSHRSDERAVRPTGGLYPPQPEARNPEAPSSAIVARCGTVVEADALRCRLDGAGIPAWVPEEFSPQLLWCLVPSPSEPVTVRVAIEDLEAALLLLALDAHSPGAEDAASAQAPSVPA